MPKHRTQHVRGCVTCVRSAKDIGIGTPGSGKKAVPDPNWEKKRCECCLMTPLEPTQLDLSSGSRYRKWGRLAFHGPLCWWCVRMSAVRFAWLNIPGVIKFLHSSDENAQDGQLASLAYISLREEGRVQITTAMVQARVSLFGRVHSVLPEIMSTAHHQVVGIQEYAETMVSKFGNPVEKFDIVQLRVDGALRLGVRLPAPRGDWCVRNGPLEDVRMGPYVQSSEPKDMEVLKSFAESAAKIDRLMPAVATEEPVASHKGAPPAASGSTDAPHDAGEQSLASGHSCGSDGAKPPGPPTGENMQVAEEIVFPRGRLGNSSQKAEAKVNSIILSMSTASWRKALRETTSRGLHRLVSGMEKELQRSEYPQLKRLNSGHGHIVQQMLDLASAAASYSRDERTTNLVKFLVPLKEIDEYKNMHFVGSSRINFDAELEMLKVDGGPTYLYGESSRCHQERRL